VGVVQLKSGPVAHLFSRLLILAIAGCGTGPVEVDRPADPHQGVTVRVACPRPTPRSADAAVTVRRATRAADVWSVAGQTRWQPFSAVGPAPYLFGVAEVALLDADLKGPSNDPADLIRACAPAWAAYHGARVEVQTYDPHAGLPADADVWVLPPCELPRWIRAGEVQPLPESLLAHGDAYHWSDLLPLYRDQLLSWEQKAWAVPLLGEGPVCCYRADWFDDPPRQEAFRRKHGRKLEAPATWDQFTEIAEFFRDEGKVHALPPLSADDRAVDRDFYTIAANYARRAVSTEEALDEGNRDEIFSFYYDLSSGQPRVAGSGFRHALGLLQRLQKCRPAGTAAAPELAFLAGRAALCWTDAPWLPFFQKEPALHDKVGVCRLPGAGLYYDFASGKERPVHEPNRVPYLGGAGWLAVVPRGARNPQAAFSLLVDLTGPAVGGQAVLEPRWGGGPVRDDALRRERWDSFDLDGPATLKLKEALQEGLRSRSLKNPVVCLRTPNEAPRRAELDAALRRALEKGGAPAAVLKEVAGRWSKLDREQGLEAHKADYLHSLGLR
jgi:multiple sugar transport system substrate-binding protein